MTVLADDDFTRSTKSGWTWSLTGVTGDKRQQFRGNNTT